MHINFIFYLCLFNTAYIGYIGHDKLDKEELVECKMDEGVCKRISLAAYGESKINFLPKVIFKVIKQDNSNGIIFYLDDVLNFEQFLFINDVFVYKSYIISYPQELRIQSTKKSLCLLGTDYSSTIHPYKLFMLEKKQLENFSNFLIMKLIFLFFNHVKLTKLNEKEIEENCIKFLSNSKVCLEFYGLEKLNELCSDIMHLQQVYNKENHRPYEIIITEYYNYLFAKNLGKNEQKIDPEDNLELLAEICSSLYSTLEISRMLIDIYIVLIRFCNSNDSIFNQSIESFIKKDSVLVFYECIIIDVDIEKEIHPSFISISVFGMVDGQITTNIVYFLDKEENKIVIDVKNILNIYKTSVFIHIEYDVFGFEKEREINITNLLEIIKNRNKLK